MAMTGTMHTINPKRGMVASRRRAVEDSPFCLRVAKQNESLSRGALPGKSRDGLVCSGRPPSRPTRVRSALVRAGSRIHDDAANEQNPVDKSNVKRAVRHRIFDNQESRASVSTPDCRDLGRLFCSSRKAV